MIDDRDKPPFFTYHYHPTPDICPVQGRDEMIDDWDKWIITTPSYRIPFPIVIQKKNYNRICLKIKCLREWVERGTMKELTLKHFPFCSQLIISKV